MTTTPPIRIAFGNVHNERAALTRVLDHGSDSAGVAEANQLTFDHSGRHVIQAGPGWADRRATDTAVLVHPNHDLTLELALRVSQAVPRYPMVAPDRALTAAGYTHPTASKIGATGVAHLCLHPVAGPDALAGNDPDHPLVKAYADAMTATRRVAQLATAAGYLIVITTDAQLREHVDKPWAPARALAKPLGLDYRVTDGAPGLDWLLYDPRLKLTRWEEFALPDHTGFAASLEATR